MILYDQNIWGNTDNPVGNRHTLIREMVDEILPDVITMQECSPTLSRIGDYPMPVVLQPEYLEVLPEKAGLNFTPVFYREATLKLLEGGYFPFEGKNDEDSKSATWAVFEEKATGKRFAMISTHFWFKAADESDNQQRMENARAVCKVAKELDEKYNIPVLVAGDLNSSNHTGQGMGGYDEFIRQGMKDVRYVAKASCDTDTLHNYPVHDGTGRYISTDEPYCTLDYVFVSKEDAMSIESFGVETTQKALLSSDHCPLIVKFEL